MALLQISEPGMAPAPHQKRLAVGIDLGTTNSLVAAVRSSVAEVLLDEDGGKLLPSVVHYGPSRTTIGEKALQAQLTDPANTLSSVKRLMGRGAADARALYKERLPYQLSDASGMVAIHTASGPKTPVEVSAEILATLRQRAEDALGDELVGAVITVPAYFDDAQRQATKDAAQLAGLNVLRLLNEPTAAAIAYGLDQAADGVFAVYDLGGGTFDISILRLSRGVFEVIATGGDTLLGGDDFDARLAGHILASCGVSAPLNGIDQAALMAKARAAKESLSIQAQVAMDVSFSGVAHSVTLDRSDFEAQTRDLIERTLTAVRQCLRDAKLRPQDVDGVVMVGGATRMPAVQEAVGSFFSKPPFTGMDPDEVVALGAALQANLLAGNKGGADEWLLLDVIPLSLGIETMGGLVERVIARNSTIPVARAQEFTTSKDGQSAMAIHVVQGERELVSDCRSLARFELRGIPPMVAGGARIRVTFQVDADGLLSVNAMETTSKVSASVEVRPSYGLSDEQITRMLKDSFESADSDMRARALREEQVETQRVIDATRSALNADGALLSEDERQRIDCLIKDAAAAVEGDDLQALKSASSALARGTEVFAARRMDEGIRTALTGRRLDELG